MNTQLLLQLITQEKVARKNGDVGILYNLSDSELDRLMSKITQSNNARNGGLR